LFKKGYKVILIKDGQFDLKEFHVNPLIISFITIIIIVPLFTLFFYINSFYNSNMNDLIDSQTQKIKNLESKNKLQSDKLDNYEFTIEKNINDNRQSLKSLNNQLKENQKRSDKIVKVLFDTKGLSDETRKVGSGGVDSIKSDKPLDNSSLNKLYDQSRLLSKKVNKIQRQINLEEVYISKIEDRFYSNIKYWKAKPSRMPLNIKRGIYISSYYGYRDDPLDGNRRFHAGDDYSANREKVKDWIGTPVKATADGVVSKAHFDNRFGNYIEIDHGYGYKTVYAHLNNISVKKGEKVHRGQEIGGVGNTGRSTAAHLHYEVKRNNKTLDPRQFYTYNYKLEDLVYYR
tara:strand:+ start:445 stop:1479 length:1035 start_codon:yes stop_codon:yes gene_type:complete